MGKHILLVIGSPTLNPQAALLQVKKKMKRSPPSPGISLHHHHRLHPLHTYASWLKVNGRYKMKMSLLKIDSDSDDEYASPTYDELLDLLKEYTQIIRKSKA
jgi:hypothetical protein